MVAVATIAEPHGLTRGIKRDLTVADHDTSSNQLSFLGVEITRL